MVAQSQSVSEAPKSPNDGGLSANQTPSVGGVNIETVSLESRIEESPCIENPPKGRVALPRIPDENEPINSMATEKRPKSGGTRLGHLWVGYDIGHRNDLWGEYRRTGINRYRTDLWANWSLLNGRYNDLKEMDSSK